MIRSFAVVRQLLVLLLLRTATANYLGQSSLQTRRGTQRSGSHQTSYSSHLALQRRAPVAVINTPWKYAVNTSAEIVDYVCHKPKSTSQSHSTRGQVKSTRSATQDQGQEDSSREVNTCTRGDYAELLYCSLRYVGERDVARCTAKMKEGGSGQPSIYCTLLIPAMFSLERSQFIWSKQWKLRPVKCLGWNHLLQLGQRVVSDCKLQDPQYDACAAPKGGCSLPFRRESCSWQWLAKVSLLALSESFAPLRHMRGSVITQINQSVACWEPILEAARRQYNLLGKWDVDDMCIATVRSVAARAVKCAVTNMYTKIYLSNRRGVIRPILEHLKLIYRDNEQLMYDRYFEPLFTRFNETARVRRSATGPVVVSCEGLRGAHPHATLLQLIRLALINDIRSSSYTMPGMVLLSLANMLLPCCLSGL
eukprot:scpid13718/ scgid33841/ 